MKTWWNMFGDRWLSPCWICNIFLHFWFNMKTIKYWVSNWFSEKFWKITKCCQMDCWIGPSTMDNSVNDSLYWGSKAIRWNFLWFLVGPKTWITPMQSMKWFVWQWERTMIRIKHWNIGPMIPCFPDVLLT